MAAAGESAPVSVPTAVHSVKRFLADLRPERGLSDADRESHFLRVLDLWRNDPVRLAELRAAVLTLLALPRQQSFFADAGVRSALGFALELAIRIGNRLLPIPHDRESLADIAHELVPPRDQPWLAAVPRDVWRRLIEMIALPAEGKGLSQTRLNLSEAARLLTYRLAGAALDRELLRAEPQLEEHESPFLALNALLVPLLERIRSGGAPLSAEELRDAEVLLDQCRTALVRVRRRMREVGASVRLTYLVARMEQLCTRLDRVLGAMTEVSGADAAIALIEELLASDLRRDQVRRFIGTNVNLLARNVTDHAARHGEHYIAEDRSGWRAMFGAAAGGGVIIAFMALAKLQIALQHLPVLVEAVAFGLLYGLGFVLIHMLGLTVATKQPAMTAAALASAIEEAHPKRLHALADTALNAVRTQLAAVAGNVGLALPVACLIVVAATLLGLTPLAPEQKLLKMLAELDPFTTGSLFFAAVAGVGLFLSGLVSGYFDNQARYLQLGDRVARSSRFAWLGPDRAQSFGRYVDEHYGAILGNLFFGLYLGLASGFGHMTGLPLDIRHVAFASANVGLAATSLGWHHLPGLVAMALVGVALIGVVNLTVSFVLAIYVAMKSKGLGATQLLGLGRTLAARILRNPLALLRPPEPVSGGAAGADAHHAKR